MLYFLLLFSVTVFCENHAASKGYDSSELFSIVLSDEESEDSFFIIIKKDIEKIGDTYTLQGQKTFIGDEQSINVLIQNKKEAKNKITKIININKCFIQKAQEFLGAGASDECKNLLIDANAYMYKNKDYFIICESILSKYNSKGNEDFIRNLIFMMDRSLRHIRMKFKGEFFGGKYNYEHSAGRDRFIGKSFLKSVSKKSDEKYRFPIPKYYFYSSGLHSLEGFRQ